MKIIDHQFYNKLYNELLKRKRINADKYEREDAFTSIVFEIDDGKNVVQAFKDGFRAVHEEELSEAVFNSAYAAVAGFSGR